jgi:hypothetical protein
MPFIIDFLIGMAVGFLVGGRKRKTFSDVNTQVDEIPISYTPPVLIPNSKPKFIPHLKNFWGPDSG